jgi:pyridoxine 4-dehydrogenase
VSHVGAVVVVATRPSVGKHDGRIGPDPKRNEGAMTDQDARPNAAVAGTFPLGADLLVNRLGFGAMRLTGRAILGEPEDPEQARRVLRRAVELGVNLIDTADSYGPERSERLIAQALHPYPDELVVATKGGYTRPGGRWVPDGRPKHLREACEGSLRRLKVERIDLYQLHRPDPRIAFEDSVWALAQLREEGKIRHVGLSDQAPRGHSITGSARLAAWALARDAAHPRYLLGCAP